VHRRDGSELPARFPTVYAGQRLNHRESGGMADAPDLGSGARKGVGVRLSPLAPPLTWEPSAAGLAWMRVVMVSLLTLAHRARPGHIGDERLPWKCRSARRAAQALSCRTAAAHPALRRALSADRCRRLARTPSSQISVARLTLYSQRRTNATCANEHWRASEW
jgi:hypothetical protein